MVVRELVALVPPIEMKSNYTTACEVDEVEEVARGGHFRHAGY